MDPGPPNLSEGSPPESTECPFSEVHPEPLPYLPGGSGSRNTTPRFAEAAVPFSRKFIPPPTEPPPPLFVTLPPPPEPRDRLPLLPPDDVAPPLARITDARANAALPSAGTKFGIESSTTTNTWSLFRFGSYSSLIFEPSGRLRIRCLTSVNTLSANFKAVFGSHASWCRAAYPGSFKVSRVCNFLTAPLSSLNPTRMRRTPRAKLCAHHFNSLSLSKFRTCVSVSITLVVFNSTYPGRPCFSPSQQSTSPPRTNR